jgi:hypothetical protein
VSFQEKQMRLFLTGLLLTALALIGLSVYESRTTPGATTLDEAVIEDGSPMPQPTPTPTPPPRP